MENLETKSEMQSICNCFVCQNPGEADFCGTVGKVPWCSNVTFKNVNC